MDFSLHTEIKLDNFDFDLPEDKIAKFPLANRESSKLLIYKNGKLSHSKFSNLISFLPEKSHLVFNNTKVIQARIILKNKIGAKIEIFLLHPFQKTKSINHFFENTNFIEWVCIIGNKKKWKSDEILESKIRINDFEVLVFAQLIDADLNLVKIFWKSTHNIINFNQILHEIGQVPLPPYLNRSAIEADKTNYQTVYSNLPGAVAAPTAGLHFTENILQQLIDNQHSTQFITLHVGAGTFLPIKETNILNHKMHNEQIIFELSSIYDLIENIGKIIPVGTTSLRAIESLYWYGVKIIENFDENNPKLIPFFIEKLEPYNSPEANILPEIALKAIIDYMLLQNLNSLIGETEIFIFPGYKFRLIKGIITNFHQPKSTLILLIASLIGSNWREIYNSALTQNYRFLSYGDSSFLMP